MRRAVLVVFLLSTVALCVAGEPGSVDRVVVYKSQRKMVLLAGGKEVKSYLVALGGDPTGAKQRQGDHRTPEGRYTLDFRNPQSRYYKSLHISYPNSQDALEAKKRGISPGGDVMLHGLPKGYGWMGSKHRLQDWTDGCIAVTNQEMDEIWKLVHVGTPIEIKP